MKVLQFLRSAAVFTATVLVAPASFAGGGVSVVVGPVGGLPGATQPIPTMSTGLVIAIAGLLAVIAVRFLRQRGAHQKILSALFIGGSVALSGMSLVEYSEATDASVPVSSGACSGGTDTINSLRPFDDSSAMLTNNCSNDVEVLAWQTAGCSAAELIVPNPVGTVIPAGGKIGYAYCPGVL